MVDDASIIDQTVLLLSATINPNGMNGAILDTQQRLTDYKHAFEYYVRNHAELTKIVFVENSGWPLEQIKDIGRHNPHKKELEFISLNSNDFPREFGKGYGEHHLIMQALDLSRLVGESRYVAKMTGRYCLINISEILKRIHAPVDVLCDLRDHPFYEWLGLPFNGRHCDTRFIVFTPEFFNAYMRDLTDSHVSGEFLLESNYYRIIKPFDASESMRCRFPIEPRYRGIAGHHGKNYSGTRERMKQSLRSLSRKVCPWLRI